VADGTIQVAHTAVDGDLGNEVPVSVGDQVPTQVAEHELTGEHEGTDQPGRAMCVCLTGSSHPLRTHEDREHWLETHRRQVDEEVAFAAEATAMAAEVLGGTPASPDDDVRCRLLEHESRQLTVALGEGDHDAVSACLGRVLQLAYLTAVVHEVDMPAQLRRSIRPPMTTAEAVRAVIAGCSGGSRSRLVLGLVATVASVHRTARGREVLLRDVVRAVHRGEVATTSRRPTRAVYGSPAFRLAGPTAPG